MLGLVNKMKVRDERGFTLVELLIVIAIIAILAAIAIPQFAAYRERGLEASMVADARNAATQLEALFGDCQAYAAGTTGVGPATVTIGNGVLGACTVAASNLGVPISASRGNTVTTAINGTGFTITVANPAVANNPKTTPLTMNGGSGVVSTCTFADGTNC